MEQEQATVSCAVRQSGWSRRSWRRRDRNFARIHKTLRVTPAMEAGVSDHVWSLEEIVGLLDRESGAEAT
jgi:hypothetical protein